MNISQKRKCGECRALESNGLTSYKCVLGYEIKPTEKMRGCSIGYYPLEVCPKPLTYKELIHSREFYSKNG